MAGIRGRHTTGASDEMEEVLLIRFGSTEEAHPCHCNCMEIDLKRLKIQIIYKKNTTLIDNCPQESIIKLSNKSKEVRSKVQLNSFQMY